MHSQKNIASFIISRAQMAIFAFFLCFVTVFTKSYAETPAGIICSKTAGEDLFLYVSGVESIDAGSSLQIGNVICDSGTISKAEILKCGFPIRTVLLLDNSATLKGIWGDQAKELMLKLIDGHANTEEFMVATYAEGLNVVSEFSNDYEALKAAVNDIQYVKQDSYLMDILYDMLNGFKDNGEANYIRIIIITDGADDKAITYTQSELLSLLKEAGVPVDTIGINTGKNNSALELLFSFSRASSGTEIQVNKSAKASDAYDKLNDCYGFKCVKVNLPENLKDGSIKAARFMVKSGDTEMTLTANLQMPFGSGKQEEPAKAETEEKKETLPATETSVSVSTEKTNTLLVISTKKTEAPEPVKKSGISPVIIGIVVGVAVLAVISVLVFVLLKGKKKNKPESHELKKIEREEPKEKQIEKPVTPPPVLSEKTELINAHDGNTVKTEMLFGSSPVAKQIRVTLEETAEPYRKFTAVLNDRIVIGRSEKNNISLSFDSSVSGEHCEITKRGRNYYLKDLGSTNKTFYNAIEVSSEVAINSGDTIGIGRGRYKVRIEE